MRRHAWLALVFLAFFAPHAHAANYVGEPPPPARPDCTSDIPQAHLGGPSAIDVQLDPDTLWRPQGTQVRFTITSTNGGQPQIAQVFACFRWELTAKAQNLHPSVPYKASRQVISPPTGDGTIQYGAMVPRLPNHSLWDVQHTSLYTVPLAQMQVLVEFSDGSWDAVILPVGITNIWIALLVLAIATGLGIAALWALAPEEFKGQATKQRGFAAISQHALALIANNDGVASLSQLQILIWTFVVAGAAIYVMVLSGNLIPISDGTLILLGIASGTTIVVRLSPTGEVVDEKTSPAWPQIFKNASMIRRSTSRACRC